ncbi:hypothetical protein VRB18_20160 [Erwinia aphidicola]
MWFEHFDIAIIMLQIVLIDLLLGGDNAVVIAMACRKLPPQMQKKAIILGTLGAIVASGDSVSDCRAAAGGAVAEDCRRAAAAVDWL